MDDTRFDDLTRRLLGISDRRDLLRGLPAGLAAALAVTPGVAKKKKRKKRKKRKQDRPFECRDNSVLCGDELVCGNCCLGEFCGASGCRCRVATDGDTFCASGGLFAVIPCEAGACPPGRRCATSLTGVDQCIPECGS